MRGSGTGGDGGALGAAGLTFTVACGGGAEVCGVAGAAGGAATGRNEGVAACGEAVECAGREGTATGGAGGAGTVNVGLDDGVGTTKRGAGAFGGSSTGDLAAGAGGAVTGFVSTGEAAVAGRAGAAAGCCLLMMAFRTSPGLEMCDRSILVLISSASLRLTRGALLAVCASLAARKWLRTFSASWSSKELEWLFFSVTPISGSTSRIALLFTSSSLARSLIRIFIRPLASGPSR